MFTSAKDFDKLENTIEITGRISSDISPQTQIFAKKCYPISIIKLHFENDRKCGGFIEHVPTNTMPNFINKIDCQRKTISKFINLFENKPISIDSIFISNHNFPDIFTSFTFDNELNIIETKQNMIATIYFQNHIYSLTYEIKTNGDLAKIEEKAISRFIEKFNTVEQSNVDFLKRTPRIMIIERKVAIPFNDNSFLLQLLQTV